MKFHSKCNYLFCLNTKDPDIGYCQEKACKDPLFAINFAENIPEADIAYCQTHVFKVVPVIWRSQVGFVVRVKEADIEYCYGHLSNEGRVRVEEYILNGY